MTPQVKLQVNDGFFGCFHLGNDHTLVAPIINLSADKALVAVPKEKLNGVNTGDHVEFFQILGAANISFHHRITAKIHWIKNLNNPRYLAAAFDFCDLADTTRDQIVYFVESERATRGQYNCQSHGVKQR